jgi:taurine dioxygenase
MAYETIEVRKITPAIGAEIVGVDLSQQLSTRQFDEIHQALMESLVIFFRDQELSVEQKAFGV